MARTAKNKDNRQKILDAAAKLISERGVAKANLRAICDEAGISTGTLYYHYKSKDLILADLLRQSLGGPEAIAHLITEKRLSPEEARSLLVKAFCERITDATTSILYLRMLNEALSGNAELTAIVQEQNDDWIDSLEVIVSWCRSEQIGVEARSLAILMESISQGLLIQYLLNEDYRDRNQILDIILGEVSQILTLI